MSVVFYACLTLIFLVLVIYCFIQDKDIVSLQKQIDWLKEEVKK